MSVQAMEQHLHRLLKAEFAEAGREVVKPDLLDGGPVQGREGIRHASQLLLHQDLEVRQNDGAACVQLVQAQCADFVLAEGVPEQLHVVAPAQLRAGLEEGDLLKGHAVIRTQCTSPRADVGPIRLLQELLEFVQDRLAVSHALPARSLLVLARLLLGHVLLLAPARLDVYPLEVDRSEVPLPIFAPTADVLEGFEELVLAAFVPTELSQAFNPHVKGELPDAQDVSAVELAELRVHVLGAVELVGGPISEEPPEARVLLVELLEGQLARLVVVQHREGGRRVAPEAHLARRMRKLQRRHPKLQVGVEVPEPGPQHGALLLLQELDDALPAEHLLPQNRPPHSRGRRCHRAGPGRGGRRGRR
mmetsp:Transcript_29125/g.96721  ORF Transcript_29125/g.96721 Transcript_29125/m.96721 type:complete len:362 (-) Transcript_29125:152-1237(-)